MACPKLGCSANNLTACQDQTEFFRRPQDPALQPVIQNVQYKIKTSRHVKMSKQEPVTLT